VLALPIFYMHCALPSASLARHTAILLPTGCNTQATLEQAAHNIVRRHVVAMVTHGL
jgi:hypothetical protein